jgi:DNA-binding transcriptional regulator YiaG
LFAYPVSGRRLLLGAQMVKMTPDEVRELRAKWGLTQAELDRRLGVGKGTARDWERAKRQVPGPAALALKLIDALRGAKRVAGDALLEAFWR